MIVVLNSLYSWAAFQSAEQSIKSLKGTKWDRIRWKTSYEYHDKMRILEGYKLENAIAQVLDCPPSGVSYDGKIDIRYRGYKYAVKIASDIADGFYIDATDHKYVDGFFTGKCLNGRTVEIYGVIATSRLLREKLYTEKQTRIGLAWFIPLSALRLFSISNHYSSVSKP